MTTKDNYKKKQSLNVVKNNLISLKSVTNQDHHFLYELLLSRDPKANISHKNMPTYSEHVKFVMSKPYSKWYVIIYKNKKIGSIYLSRQNEIGIFLKKEFHGKRFGSKALCLLIKFNPRQRYLANVSPINISSQKFFENNGFKLIQYTYEMIIHNGSLSQNAKKN